MKKAKLSLHILLITALVVCLMPLIAVTAKAESYGDLEYKILKDNTIEITGYNGHDACVEIPQEINGMAVSSIGSLAFENCSSLTSITIPEGVTSIGMAAFRNCSSLTSITIPNGVLSIDFRAFDNCSSLKNIALPDSLIIIERWAFSGCSSLEEITIPNSVETIGYCAFDSCSSLKSVHIPASVRSFTGTTGQYFGEIYGLFPECESLESVTVSPDNPVYDSRNDCNAIIETATGTLVAGCISTVIPDSVTGIGMRSFRRISGLERIKIPEGVTYIASEAFSDCNSLKSIEIPGSVEKITEGAFNGCGAIEKITVSPDNKVFDSRGDCNAIIKTETNRLVVGCKNTVIPEDIEVIGIYAFGGCTDIENITIPDSVTSIEYGAFYYCSGLKRIRIPKNVNYIGVYAFAGCSALENITIPDKVTEIGSGAFANCSGVSSVMIPKSVTYIGGGAFKGCSSLTDVYYSGTEEDKNNIDINNYGTEEIFNATWHYSYNPAIAKGDVDNDGNVNAKDITALAKHVAKIAQITDYDLLRAADVNGDDKIDSKDLTYLAKYVAKIIPEL